MQFTSTRNSELSVSFSKAVRDCIPSDGGVFIPSSIEDLRRWIYYIDANTPLDSIAGTLSSAFFKDEFSPIICETIATNAFTFEPVVRHLDDKLYVVELFHGYTGTHRDFGVSYLCSYLETTLELNGGKALFLDFTHGTLGALLAKILKGKKNIKAVLVYQKGTVKGLDEEDFVWNGGNIYPVEMEGSESQIKAEISKIFQDKEFVKKFGLTVANTTNVCRLLAQVFFFPYAFSRIKNKLCGDIYYGMDAENYGTLMGGLYSWRFALPVNGFILPSTNALARSPNGSPVMLDSFVNIENRTKSNPLIPANLERLEAFFGENELMLRDFVFPVDVTEEDTENAAKELFMKYGLYACEGTCRAYAAALSKQKEIFDEDGAIVLMSSTHPAYSEVFLRHVLGESPEMPEYIRHILTPTEAEIPLAKNSEDLKSIITKNF